MPLPAGGATPWPPQHCDPINRQYAIWSAWYSGDIEQLTGIYAGRGGAADTTGFFASEQGGFRNNVRRAAELIRRWFWGSQLGRREQRQRLHVPIASDIASASSDLLFSEPPKITVPAAEVDPNTPPPAPGTTPIVDPTQQRLNELLDDGMHATLLEAAEICAALGGVYLRVVWDPAERDRTWLTAVHPDVAVPEWKWGRLSAVTFWRVIHAKGKVVVRHLERHERGKIIHGVYEGTNDELGQVVPLTDYEATQGLANEQLVDGNTILTGAKGLTAVYVPNMRPNRIWRNTPHAAHLGRSDFAGVESLMDALDLTYSSLIRDVELGKARLVVPREYMQSNGSGQGAIVDLDQELYEPINIMGSEDGSTPQITQVQFKIRVDEHDKVISGLKTTIVGNAGYSAGTFGLDGGVAVTATEVAAKQRRSYITRDRKICYWRPELANIVEAQLEVEYKLFGTAIIPIKPNVTFADGVSIDPKALAEELNLLSQATAISTEQKVRRQHPDWDDPDIDEEVEKIDGKPLEDPGTFTGADPGPNALPPSSPPPADQTGNVLIGG